MGREENDRDDGWSVEWMELRLKHGPKVRREKDPRILPLHPCSALPRKVGMTIFDPKGDDGFVRCLVCAVRGEREGGGRMKDERVKG